MPSAEPDSQETEGLLEQAAAGDSLARERLLQCHRCSGSAAARAGPCCHDPRRQFAAFRLDWAPAAHTLEGLDENRMSKGRTRQLP
jgi:hypothetical protein